MIRIVKLQKIFTIFSLDLVQINEPPESSTLNQIPPQEAMAGVDFSSFFLSDCIIGTQGLSPEEKNLSSWSCSHQAKTLNTGLLLLPHTGCDVQVSAYNHLPC